MRPGDEDQSTSLVNPMGPDPPIGMDRQVVEEGDDGTVPLPGGYL